MLDVIKVMKKYFFEGKASFFFVKEFGNDCIMFSMDKLFEYGDAINIIGADERNRISE